MWHLSDDEERRERRLPGEGIDISWLSDSTRAAITHLFYSSTAQEGKCAVDNCSYSILSRRKLLDHIVTHRIIYTTDCQYITSRRDSAVKHLRTCHGRKGSITQVDADRWRRLRESNPSLPTSCPSLPMTPLQYRRASRCTETDEQPSGGVQVLVKRNSTSRRTVKVSKQKPPPVVEEAAIVLVERRMELRRQLIRLEEDHQAAERLKRHLEEDIEAIKARLAEGKRRN